MSKNKNEADANVEGWFRQQHIPYTPDTANKLSLFGVACVEDLKLYPSNLRDNLFRKEKPIVKNVVLQAWVKLGNKRDFSFEKAAVTTPLDLESETASPATNAASLSNSGTKTSNSFINVNGTRSVLESGMTRKITKTGALKKLEREAREEERKKRRKLQDDIATVNNTDNNADTATATVQTKTSTPTNNSRPSKLLALPPSDFRMERCFLSSALTDAADDDERTC